MKRSQRQTKQRSCSKLVISRAPHTDDYDRVTLSCGHERLVNFERPHHICFICQQAEYGSSAHTFNWCLQTAHGFVLTTTHLFKPVESVDRTCVKRFRDRRSAQAYAKTLRVSANLGPIRWDTLLEEDAA
ncbi:MAG: hypothetical protein KME27_11015 [Lyngbya sp. HA4199-MV5]|nr:hypothetical protein [Lyngbya sp. HA4199-MV5]